MLNCFSGLLLFVACFCFQLTILRSQLDSDDSELLKKSRKEVSLNFVSSLEPQLCEVRSLTKLNGFICILCGRDPLAENLVTINSIRFYEDRSPFDLVMVRPLEEIADPYDIVSNAKDERLYVTEGPRNPIIWTIGLDDHRAKIWKRPQHWPFTLSVTSVGSLLLQRPGSLEIYRSDAKLRRNISLPEFIKWPFHSVRERSGQFVIIHNWIFCRVTSSGQVIETLYLISEPYGSVMYELKQVSFDARDGLLVAVEHLSTRTPSGISAISYAQNTSFTETHAANFIEYRYRSRIFLPYQESNSLKGLVILSDDLRHKEYNVHTYTYHNETSKIMTHYRRDPEKENEDVELTESRAEQMRDGDYIQAALKRQFTMSYDGRGKQLLVGQDGKVNIYEMNFKRHWKSFLKPTRVEGHDQNLRPSVYVYGD